MPITILDYVKTVTGDKDTYSGADFAAAGVAMLGGCENCAAAIAAYNAYPSMSGYWRCAECIGEYGYATVTAFAATIPPPIACPACGNTDTISEARILTIDYDELPALECGDCGEVWQP